MQTGIYIILYYMIVHHSIAKEKVKIAKDKDSSIRIRYSTLMFFNLVIYAKVLLLLCKCECDGWMDG